MTKLNKFSDEEFGFIRNSFAEWFDKELITGFNIYNRIIYPDVEIPFNYLHGIEEHRIFLSDKLKTIQSLENLVKDIEDQTFRRSALYEWEKDFEIPKEKKGSLKRGFELMLLREGITFSKDVLARISKIEEVYQGDALIVAIEECYDISFPVDSKKQAISLIKFFNRNVFRKKIDERGLVTRDKFGKPKEDSEEYLPGAYVVPLIVFNDRFNLFSKLDTFSRIRKIMLYRDKNEISFCIDQKYNDLKNSDEYKGLENRFGKDFHDHEIFANNEFIRYINKTM